MREDFRNAHPVVQLIILILIGFGAMFVLALLAFIPFALSGYGLEVLANSSQLTTENHMEILMLKVLQITQACGLFIVPYLVYRWLIKGSGYGLLQLKYVGVSSMVIFGIAVFAAFPLINFLAAWNSALEFPIESINEWIHSTEGGAEDLIRLFLETDSIGGLLFNIFLIALIPAVGEEMLFRGTFQPLMLRTFKGNYHLAIWVTAFWFSFMHLQFLGFFPRLMLGAMLGYAAHWSGSLLLPMIGHFVNNAVAVVVFYLIGINALNESAENFGASNGEIAFAGVSLLLLGVGLAYVYRNSSFRKNSVTVSEG